MGWRAAIGVWAAISLVAFALWLYLYLRDASLRKKEHPQLVGGHAGRQKIWKSKTAVALMFFFGLQSMQAYIQFGWAPVAYRAGGLDATSAGIMISIIALGGIPGGLVMPWLVSRGRGLQSLITVFGALLAIGYLGIAFLPTTLPWLWALCLSVAGFCFPTALALIIDKTRHASITAALSGFVQPVGYLLAAVGPFLVGITFGAIGNWEPILIVLALTAVPMSAAGIVAVRGGTVDEQLKVTK
ncbi:MFS transporter [Schaalia sp. JY-X169]|uniref:MFS transporter n=1 Tax=Schaalia sp. JY-X169 TaxID=2758572 RepID=UPI0015F76838|nr:MFS transporter [Schaalia sp. JY-X169]